MSTVIKATDRNADVQPLAFNFDDVTTKANHYLTKVRAEAAKIIAAAQNEAKQTRQDAHSDSQRAGFEAGRQEGLKNVEQMVATQLAEQLNTLMPALRQTVGDIQHAKQAWLTHFEKSAVHVACSIAERLIRRELPNKPEIPLTLIREALELAAGSPVLQIHLHPDDHETLLPQVDLLIRELVGAADTQVLADDQITPGGCRIETSFGMIDQQFETPLARIEEELT